MEDFKGYKYRIMTEKEKIINKALEILQENSDGLRYTVLQQKNKISDVKFQFNYTSNKNQDLSSQTTTNPINNSTVVLIQNSPLSNNDMLPSLLITKKEEVIPLHTGSMETINSLMQTDREGCPTGRNRIYP